MKIPLPTLALLVAVGAGNSVLSVAVAGDARTSPVRLGNATCPVLGRPVDAKVVKTWNGVEVAFCCPECPERFAADPVVFLPALLKDLAGQLATTQARLAKYEAPLATAPAPSNPAEKPVSFPIDLGNAVCPVMGGAAKSSVTTEYHGMKIRLCCPGCDRRFQADPSAFLRKLREDPVVARRMDVAEAAWSAAGKQR